MIRIGRSTANVELSAVGRVVEMAVCCLVCYANPGLADAWLV